MPTAIGTQRARAPALSGRPVLQIAVAPIELPFDPCSLAATGTRRDRVEHK